jgi:AhpC/TSA family
MERMHTAVRRIAAIALAALLAPACGGASSPSSDRPPTDSQRDRERRSGENPTETAPDFSVETFAGAQFRLSEQRGMPVVLNFWESW